jgi:hypothetical protein
VLLPPSPSLLPPPPLRRRASTDMLPAAHALARAWSLFGACFCQAARGRGRRRDHDVRRNEDRRSDRGGQDQKDRKTTEEPSKQTQKKGKNTETTTTTTHVWPRARSGACHWFDPSAASSTAQLPTWTRSRSDMLCLLSCACVAWWVGFALACMLLVVTQALTHGVEGRHAPVAQVTVELSRGAEEQQRDRRTKTQHQSGQHTGQGKASRSGLRCEARVSAR